MPQSFVITNECGDGSRVYKADSFFKAARKAHRDNKCASQIVIKCVSSGECMAFELSSLSFAVKKPHSFDRNVARAMKDDLKEHPDAEFEGLYWSESEGGWISRPC